MAGGVAILLLVIILIFGGVIALSVYTTGGFLWWRKTDPNAETDLEQLDDLGTRPRRESGEDDRQPQHTAPRTTAQDKTDFV